MSDAIPFRLLHNLTLLGAPGSGKGFYGRLLAKAWGVPLITTSTILRDHFTKNRQVVDLDSGRLVDSQTVSDILFDFLSSTSHQEQAPQQQGQSRNPYILDGFPRTLRQLELMKSQWPTDLQVHAAVFLDIPDTVCQEKSLGRRHCSICNQGVNIADVQHVGTFDLPPTYPSECRFSNEDRYLCRSSWTRRKDDTLDIIQERLRIHHENYDPVIDSFRKEQRLLKVTPFRGVRDFPFLQKTCEDWLIQHSATLTS